MSRGGAAAHADDSCPSSVLPLRLRSTSSTGGSAFRLTHGGRVTLRDKYFVGLLLIHK